MPEMVTFGKGAEGSPLAAVLAQLINHNLEKGGARLEAFRKLSSPVYFKVTDVGVEILLLFKKGTLTIHSEKPVKPAISFITDSETLLELTNINLRGLKMLSDKNNRNLARKVLRGELKIKGLLLHPLELLRLAKVLS
ncbi:MAG: SCP2 sterol-binding domain-containing protein [Firmicutes bacterium]|nr:SCP2 sterol-binding domain-containing protein [Bacillota bacterium]